MTGSVFAPIGEKYPVFNTVGQEDITIFNGMEREEEEEEEDFENLENFVPGDVMAIAEFPSEPLGATGEVIEVFHKNFRNFDEKSALKLKDCFLLYFHCRIIFRSFGLKSNKYVAPSCHFH